MARTDPRPHYGSKRRVGPGGYIYIWEPQHPLTTRHGYVSEHRKIAWDNGLLTDAADQIHHINGDRTDNRLENLQVVTASAHTLLHWEEKGRPAHCPQGHVYDEENTAYSRGWRYCKTCNRERVRRWNARQREAAA